MRLSRTLAGALAGVFLLSLNAYSAGWPTLDIASSDGVPMPLPDKAALDAASLKIHPQLRPAATRGVAPGALPAALVAGDRVLVEVRFDASARAGDVEATLARTGAVVRNALDASRVEAWLPRDRLVDLAGDAGVAAITPARLVRHFVGNRTSQGVAAGRADRWLGASPAIDGDGVTIALIDGFNNTSNNVNSLQASGDWPPDSRLTLLNYKTFAPGTAPASCSSNTFGCLGEVHGNSTLEIAYDVAPGARYRAYDTVTVGDWRRAILDAASLTATGGSSGAVKANIISASLGAPLDGKGDGTALVGSIAEAAGWARNRGVLTVNAAGNEREQHWDGDYRAASTAGFHSWSGSNTVYNYFGNGSNSAYCIPAGEVISVDLYWNNWTTNDPATNRSNRDYDVFLYRRTNGTTWEATPVASSEFPQIGQSGQTPQEQVQFVTSGSTTGCSNGGAVYGVAIKRISTSGSNFLQVFANIPLNWRVNERSLSFPADSPNVLTVGAIDVANSSTTPQESFSSEGPVLTAGGGNPGSPAPVNDTNVKPDVASFDNVTTVSFVSGSPPQQTSFFGTSASTPHVAGMAALYMQRVGIPTSAATLDATIIAPLRQLAGTGTNDLGPAGRDYKYGYGRLRFQRENSLDWVQQPGNVNVGATMAPGVAVRVLDDEGVVVPVGIYSNLALSLGSNPGGASLTGGGNAALAQGVATWSGVSLNRAGTGYTLRATAAGLPNATSATFNVMATTATRLRFAATPGNGVAGAPLAPVQVRLEDGAGNLVTADSTTPVTLYGIVCPGVPVQGGGPVTASNGIATFTNVRLYKTGTATLRAEAGGLSSTTTQSFAIGPNNDLVFFDGFSACTP